MEKPEDVTFVSAHAAEAADDEGGGAADKVKEKLPDTGAVKEKLPDTGPVKEKLPDAGAGKEKLSDTEAVKE